MGEYRKFIFVCNGGDCKDSGCKKLTGELKELASMPAHKGKYKIVKTKCMDFCKNSPVVIFREEVVKKATVDKLKELMS